MFRICVGLCISYSAVALYWGNAAAAPNCTDYGEFERCEVQEGPFITGSTESKSGNFGFGPSNFLATGHAADCTLSSKYVVEGDYLYGFCSTSMGLFPVAIHIPTNTMIWKTDPVSTYVEHRIFSARKSSSFFAFSFSLSRGNEEYYYNAVYDLKTGNKIPLKTDSPLKYNKKLILNASTLVANQESGLTGFELSTGKEKWKDKDSRVIKFDANNDVIFAVTTDKYKRRLGLVALDLNTGNIIWEQKFQESDAETEPSVYVASETVLIRYYYPNAGWKTVAFAIDSGAERWQCKNCYQTIAGHSNGLMIAKQSQFDFSALSEMSGEVAWQSKIQSPGYHASFIIDESGSYVHNLDFESSSVGQRYGGKLTTLSIADGLQVSQHAVDGKLGSNLNSVSNGRFFIGPVIFTKPGKILDKFLIGTWGGVTIYEDGTGRFLGYDSSGFINSDFSFSIKMSSGPLLGEGRVDVPGRTRFEIKILESKPLPGARYSTKPGLESQCSYIINDYTSMELECVGEGFAKVLPGKDRIDPQRNNLRYKHAMLTGGALNNVPKFSWLQKYGIPGRDTSHRQDGVFFSSSLRPGCAERVSYSFSDRKLVLVRVGKFANGTGCDSAGTVQTFSCNTYQEYCGAIPSTTVSFHVGGFEIDGENYSSGIIP